MSSFSLSFSSFDALFFLKKILIDWCSCRSRAFLVLGLCSDGWLDRKRSSYHSNEGSFRWVGTAARSWFPLSYLISWRVYLRERGRDEWPGVWLEIGFVACMTEELHRSLAGRSLD